VFSEWCGPCKSVLPTFKRIRMDREDERALLFLTIPAEKCSFLNDAVEHRGKSEPLFLLFRVREPAGERASERAAAAERRRRRRSRRSGCILSTGQPPPPGRSAALCASLPTGRRRSGVRRGPLLIAASPPPPPIPKNFDPQNGRLKGKVEGANTPDLDKHVYALVPMNADADELDDNPIYQAWKKKQDKK
jgi:thiol-disulfide isomerase/thioredoxin